MKRYRMVTFRFTLLMCILFSWLFNPQIDQINAATATSVVGGRGHSCALMSGNVWCWGENDAGQLGNGTTTNSYGATRVRLHTGAFLDKVTAIASDYDITCALRLRVVYCWGAYNSTSSPFVTKATPIQFPNGRILSNVSKVAVGGEKSCAIRLKAVWCWHNSFDKNTTELVRTKSGTLNNVSDIALGMYFGCATVSGYVWCWGSNMDGALGSGTSIYDRTYADRVLKTGGGYLNNVRMLAAGGVHTCTVRNDNSIWCWGSNDEYELGDGSLIDKNKAVKFIETHRIYGRITHISAGHAHTCIVSNQKSSCWGLDNFGQSSYSSYDTDFKNANVLSIGTGTLHSCAIKLNAVWCWGNNNDGALGDGTINSNNQPPSLVVYANFRPFR